MALSIDEIKDTYDRYRRMYDDRDQRMNQVLLVRQGKMRDVYPDLFPDGPFENPIVANMVDIAARDLAETIAPLPAFNCNSTSMVSEAIRKKADKREEIVNGIVDFSDLQSQMYNAADRYVTYGFVPAQVEVDYEAQMPRIRFMDSLGAYPVIDRFGRCTMFFQRIMKPTQELMSQYPEIAHLIYDKNTQSTMSEVVRFHDKDQDVIFLPQRSNLVLDRAPNPMGECMVRVVRRPSLDDQSRGQFDDVLAIQVAKARYALLSLEAATKSVQAPIAMPQDVQELALGPDAIMRSSKPNEIRRVPLELPANTFQQQHVLESELRLGSRYPETRTGNSDASIITGRGVQALMGGFDTQIKTAHSMFARAFTELMALALKTDEKVFGKQEKTLEGIFNGTPYNIKYKPSRDIDGDYTVDVQYGLMAGLDPNRALVFGLQARGDKLISRDFLRRQMPFNFNATQEEEKVETEELRDAMKQAIASYAQAIPALASQGQDPSDILMKLSTVISERQKGVAIEDAIQKAWLPQNPPPAATPAEVSPQMGQPGAVPAGAGQELPQGLAPTGRMQGVAAGQISPGGRPDIQSLLAGLTQRGEPNLQASLIKRLPAQDGGETIMAFGNPVKPKNQPGKASKPANQGGAAQSKATTSGPIKTGTPKGGKPKASVTMLTKQPSGTRGSK